MAIPASSPGMQMAFSYFEGLAEPGVKFDGTFFGYLQTRLGVLVMYLCRD
jgi:hypothetical protein